MLDLLRNLRGWWIRRRKVFRLEKSSSQNSKRCYLTDVPVEILDYIVSFIDNPKDLLSFALSSKRPSAVILPAYIQSRHLRCDVRRTSLWMALARSPLIASRCVSLEIIPEPRMGTGSGSDVIVPVFLFAMGLGPNVDMRYRPLQLVGQMQAAHFAATYIGAFLAAVQCMPALTRFHWTLDCPPTSSVFSTLRDSCPALSDLCIEINDHLGWEYDVPPAPFWEFHNLSRVSFVVRSSRINGDFTSLYLERLLDMLINYCTRLEHLHLNGIHAASTIFTRGRWPHLKTLYLDESGTTYYPEHIVHEFFNAHRDLERLNIGIRGISPSVYPLHLRELTLQQRDPVPLTPGMMSCLEFLSLPDIPIHPPLWLDHASALRVLVVHDVPLASAMKYIVQAIPSIERLHMIWPSGHLRRVDVESEDPNSAFTIGCKFLAQFTHLTHLSHFVHMLDIPNDLVDTVLRKFTRVCPTLLFVEMRVCGQCRWATVERHAGDGSYTGWHYTEKLRGIRVKDWGGHFFSHL